MNLLYSVIIKPLYLIIECIYEVFYKITGIPGISVIGVSIGITLLCLPLYAVAEHWQQVERDTEKKLKPGIERIKNSFKGDEQYMILSTYYKENHYHPLMALRSSFGLLIQIPFFIAAYAYLSQVSALKGQSFLFIRDMGVQDALFTIGSFPVNILPIAMTVINIIAGAIYTKGFPVKEKIQIYGMALVFLALLYNSPSGLVLYWTMNNVFSLIKNIFYKLKNPLKGFWIFCTALCIPLFIYFTFVSRMKVLYRVVACMVFVIVGICPLIVKGFTYLLNKPLASLVNNTKARNTVFISACVCLFLLSGFAIPSSLIGSSPVEFANIGGHFSPLYFVYNTAAQSFGLWVFWSLCIYFLFNARIQTLFAVIYSIIFLYAISNTYIFALSYGDISQTLSFISGRSLNPSKLISMLDLLVLAVIAILCIFFLGSKKGKIFSSLFMIAIISLGAVSVANCYSISNKLTQFKKQSTAQGNDDKVSLSPIFHFSKTGQNVVLLMLDRAQSQYMNAILEECPELAQTYSGFVYYPNTVSFNGHTLMAAPSLFGGYEYTPAEINKRDAVPLVEKNTEALLLLPRLFSEEKGFTATITDPSWANYNTYCDLSILKPFPKINGYKTIGKYNDIWFEKSGTKLTNNTAKQLERNLFMFSIFRESPVFLREVVYKKGTYWSSDNASIDTHIVIDNYSALDFLPELTDFECTEKGSYISIVNELTHEDVFFEAPDYVPADIVTHFGESSFSHEQDYHTEIAALKRVGEWLTLLKSNNVYDNTRIVIVADHSFRDTENCFEKNEQLDKEMHDQVYSGRGHYHPLLLYKDFNSHGAMVTDATFMTNADTPSLLLKGLFDNPVNPFTQKPITLDTTSLKKDGVLITVSDNHQPQYNAKNTFTINKNDWWLVKDDIFKSANWVHTEKENSK